MPLDKPTVPAFVHAPERDHGRRQWVGSKGDWIAFSQDDGPLTMRNVYAMVEITLPSLENVGISRDHPWPPDGPEAFRFKYKLARTELLKIQISTAPYLADDVWRYEAIAVFDKLIAFVQKPRDREWIILRNNSLAPRRYVDAVAIPNTDFWGHLLRIYVVTEPRGDIVVWEPYTWGESYYMS